MTARQDDDTAVAWPDGTARVYSHGPHRVVELSGAIDADAEERVASAFETALSATRHGTGRVIVDLSRVEFADSAALHLLLRARAAAGDHLRIAGPLAPQVRLLFDVTDLAGSFAIHRDLEHALAA